MEKETRVYGIDSSRIYDGITLTRLQDHELSDEEFMSLSEAHGLVWSLKGFAHAYNIDDISYDVYIRFI